MLSIFWCDDVFIILNTVTERQIVGSVLKKSVLQFSKVCYSQIYLHKSLYDELSLYSTERIRSMRSFNEVKL